MALDPAVLDHLGVRPGDPVAVNLLPDGRVEISARVQGAIEAFHGSLARDGQRAFSIDEINEAIADGWAELR